MVIDSKYSNYHDSNNFHPNIMIKRYGVLFDGKNHENQEKPIYQLNG